MTERTRRTLFDVLIARFIVPKETVDRPFDFSSPRWTPMSSGVIKSSASYAARSLLISSFAITNRLYRLKAIESLDSRRWRDGKARTWAPYVRTSSFRSPRRWGLSEYLGTNFCAGRAPTQTSGPPI